MIVKVRHVDDEDSYEVDTPNIAFVVMQPGDYRIDVDPDGNRTEVTVWRGRGQVTGGGSSYTVVANQDATFTGTDQQLNYDLGQVPADDALDTWALDRDRVEEGSDSANYVSREMTGYEDLDEYGDWTYVAGYGPCWRPRGARRGMGALPAGHWAWVGPWGWTWVEDEPWGFAPFHYGRWALAGAGWFWVPGPVVVRPVYAPALVAWVGGGPGRNFSFSFAGVGWFPLAPGEVFIPGYRVSRTYVNRVNITNTTVNVTRITNVYNNVVINRNTTVNNIAYANRNVNGGVTVVSRDTFVNARSVARNVVSVPAKEIAAAPVSHVAAAEPVRSSVMGAGKSIVNRPPAAVTSRPVVALRTPAPMPRSLDQRQAQAGGHLNQSPLVRQQVPGRPVPAASSATNPSSATNQGSRPQPSQDGFRPFGEPNTGNAANDQTKPPSRVWEAQGTPEPEKATQPNPETHGVQTSGGVRSSQPQASQQWSHPLAKPAPPVQQRSAEQEREQEQKFSNWHQQRPASTPPQKQSSPPPSHSTQSAPKKGH